MPTSLRLDPNKLDKVRRIVVHDSCSDGTASAILLRDAFPACTIEFHQYGTAAYTNLQPTPGMLFCDITPPANHVDQFVTAGTIVLDHHKSARWIVDRFGADGVFGDEQTEPGVCGAVLAYRHVWVPRKGGDDSVTMFAEKLATLAGIRDTWQKQDPRWYEACVQSNALHFYPNEYWMGQPLEETITGWPTSERIGAVLYERHIKSTQRLVDKAYRCTTARGTRIVMFDSLASSDAAELIGQGADLIVGFMASNEDQQLKYIFSTRSHTGYDCSALARHHGGGGHTAAAGFNMKIDPNTTTNPYGFVLQLIERYEG